MTHYALYVDIEKCNGCHACFLSCKDEHVGNNHLPVAAAQPEGQQWLRVQEVEYGAGDKVKVDYIPITCQHCENPICGTNAPEGAVYTRPDGIVIIDPEKAKGAKSIVKNCPYGVVFWNEEEDLPQKCTLCAHLLDSGEKTTRCADCCPTGALVFGDLGDPNSEISMLAAEKAGRLEVYKPGFGTKPGVKYLNLPKPFVAGELVYADDPGEPASGVDVELTCLDNGKVRQGVTDFFGDFEFKGLDNNAEYLLAVQAPGYKPVESHFRSNAAKNLGAVKLEKA